MIFVLDNYDSFTYNLVQRLGEIDAALDIRVARNDRTTIEEIEALSPERLIVSPGPCTPGEAGISKEVIAYFAPKLPVLGVCLGHQCLAEVYGADVVRADRLMHGKISAIHHNGKDLFAGIESPCVATRYHSLVVPESSLGSDLVATAWTRDADHEPELMGIRHRKYPAFGVQFHPESFLSEAGVRMLENFLEVPVMSEVA
ncbi:MAG: aminodeoxychorismate/anthranilate synthase component II [Planctomycetota bacterium]|nr:MAG: aminodeoxychorismate/anthranilate synthase component II [Planctomycetota bacterium]REJ90529.1 MAG: aminodeoxychorismate/anthranilate synthase component II [Planctomycetota bacterium]REK24152.1 MAG: aminodeoxychorismate/anthranilate synthase component II [Planctomycetota bacterium]REK38392.1 MAG: aminodeoxychorismate/anthranilate synthase component II [Planctomycetota bacterium]